MSSLKKLNKKLKLLEGEKNNFKKDLKKINREVEEIKTFNDFNRMLSNQDRNYNYFLKTNFREEKEKDKTEHLDKIFKMRITEEDRQIIKFLKTKKINVSEELRNFLRKMEQKKYYELHLEKIKLNKIELKKIKSEMAQKIKLLSKLLFKKFNLKNAEERYILKFEIKDLQIKKNKIETYLKKLEN